MSVVLEIKGVGELETIKGDAASNENSYFRIKFLIYTMCYMLFVILEFQILVVN